MKSAAYMAWIILIKTCKISDKVYYNYGDNEFFPNGFFLLVHPVCSAEWDVEP